MSQAKGKTDSFGIWMFSVTMHDHGIARIDPYQLPRRV